MIFSKIKLDWGEAKEEGIVLRRVAYATFQGYDLRFTIINPVYDDKSCEGTVEMKVKTDYSGTIWRTIYHIPPIGLPVRFSFKETKGALEHFAYKINKQIRKNLFTK